MKFNMKTGWYEVYNKLGELHNLKGPARVNKSAEMWFKNGMKHRKGAPAVKWSNGSEEWWHNGGLHREDGPAVYGGLSTYWYDHGKRFNNEADWKAYKFFSKF
jgi:hypothetical protein